jgi:hypothetical protein
MLHGSFTFTHSNSGSPAAAGAGPASGIGWIGVGCPTGAPSTGVGVNPSAKAVAHTNAIAAADTNVKLLMSVAPSLLPPDPSSEAPNDSDAKSTLTGNAIAEPTSSRLTNQAYNVPSLVLDRFQRLSARHCGKRSNFTGYEYWVDSELASALDPLRKDFSKTKSSVTRSIANNRDLLQAGTLETIIPCEFDRASARGESENMKRMYGDDVLRIEATALVIACSVGLLMLAGCGGSGGKGSSSKSNAGGEAEEPQGDGGGKVATTTSSKSKGGAQSKRPMIGDIPLDVWFDDPLAVAATKGSVAQANPAPATVAQASPSAAAANGAPPATADTSPPAAAGGDEWSSLMAADVFVDEVKQIRLRLNQSLSGVGLYNGNYKNVIVPDGAELAMLSGIVTRTKVDGISWKDNAHLVREFASQVAANAKGLGQAPFDATKQAFENLDGVLSGNKPAKVPENVAPTVPFHEASSVKQLMKRLERTENLIKAVTNEALLKKGADEVAREASVLAVIGKVVSTEGYTGADEEDYQKFAKDIIKAAQDMTTAAKDGNYATFEDAKNRMTKSCSDCHLGYRTGN